MLRRWRASVAAVLVIFSFSAAFAATEATVSGKLSLKQAIEQVSEQHPGVVFAADNFVPNLVRGISECRNSDASREISSLPPLSCGALNLLDPLQQQRLIVARRFLDIALADQRAGRDSEAMAVAYVELDRARNRMELGQFSDMDVVALESVYEEVRRQNTTAGLLQRTTRSSFAKAINSSTLPSDITLPDISSVLERPLPKVEELTEKVLSRNPVYNSLREEREDYSGDMQALSGIVAQQLRHTVLELVFSLDVLKVALAEADSKIDYRNLYLDRSRTMYEMEVKADLGDSMTQQTDAMLFRMKTRYQYLMVWVLIDALQGETLTIQ